MNKPTPNPWVACPRPNPAARLRLFCFPYAGAGASVYFGWWKDLPAAVEVCAIQLPGRESRLREPLSQHIAPTVQALATALGPLLHTPYAFFGHSFGALVSFEVARELRRVGAPAPAHLFVSGRRAPQLPDPDPLHGLTEAEFVAKLSRMEGTPQAVLQEPELMEIFLPILRGDLAANETYEHRAEAPFDVPLSAFSGATDARAPRDSMEPWREHTRRAFTLETFPGGHFFLKSHRAELLRSMSRTLEATLLGAQGR